MKKLNVLLPLALTFTWMCTRTETPTQPTQESGIVLSDRLSNLHVNAFAEDKDGQIWMGTYRGLNKYTIHEYQQFFCTDDSLGLPDNQINALLSAQDGTLWVSTVAGVARRTPEGVFRRVPFPGNTLMLTQFLQTREGDILAADGGQVLRYNASENAFIPVLRDIAAFGAPSVVLSDNKLWVLSSGGWQLNSYSTDNFTLLKSVSLPHQAYHLCDGGNGELWLSGMGRLSILDKESLQAKALPAPIAACKGLMEGDIDILFKVDDQSMLLNVIGKGFYLYNRPLGTVLHQDDTTFPLRVPDAEVRTIFRDSHANLWFGTEDQGFTVSYAAKSQFAANPFLTGAMKGKDVKALCPDKDGGLWIATYRHGLYRYDLRARTLERVDISRLIPDSDVGYIRANSVFCDSRGDIWLLLSEKLRAVCCRWDGRRLTVKDAFYCSNPLSITEDDRGYIWVSGLGGFLTRYNKQTRERDDIALAEEGQWTLVTDMTLLEPGRLLVACFNMPPVEVNTYSLEKTIREIPAKEKHSILQRHTLIPTRILKDSEGDIWLGTISNGLFHTKWQNLECTPIDGLPCQDVCSIEEDRQGNIWVSTMHGLARYDRTVSHFVHYFESDGIGGDQFNNHASCLLPDGTLVFGGTHGITWFNPLDERPKRTVPLVFQNLTIHNQLVRPSEDGPISKELSEKPQVTIKDSQNAFDISFAALDYSEYEQVRYAYKLEGFDKDWVKINTRHNAYFANLPAGNYTLWVRIANANHSITDTKESLSIKVLPPWYASWWARLLWLLLGLFLLGIAYTFVRHIRRVRKDAARRIRQVRREREQAEQAEKAEKELNRIQMNYFSNVAHEFRTPLTMIAGPAQQLSASEGVKGQDRQLVDIIRRNSTWMLSLVNQLLDFNRIGNSKLQLKVAKMDIVQPLKDSASLFRFNAQSKGIELSTHGLEDPFTMWVDADKVQNVVMNLLSNALKFTPAGGKVSLGFDVISRAEAAARFPLSEADADGQWASISVSDNGPGIPSDQLEKIFERFYQSEDGKKLSGSGIGLFYSRTLAQLHHGFIRAWNREEGGSLFQLVLPVSSSAYTEDERSTASPGELPTHALAQSITADEPDTDQSKRHIVVVDDDIDIANYLKVLLKPQYKVTLYFDGASALKGMAEDAPDLIISDVVMPGMDGYELCASIKGDLQLSHIPVVLVTAKVAVESQVEGLYKGADAYVTKPFQPTYLLALVKSLLENREKLRRQLGSATTTEGIAPEALSPRDAAFMRELYELMEKELSNAELDITRITGMMKISRTKFYYKVKGLTGENPSVFFKRYKLNRAADLLKEGIHNMSEIAWMTGFNTLSHFSTSFKKQFGVPPSEYQG